MSSLAVDPMGGFVGELTLETVASGWFELPPTSIAFVVDEAADASVCP